jgi:hypothetical protein
LPVSNQTQQEEGKQEIMSDDKNKQDDVKQTNEEVNQKQELADEDLDYVSGGFNPQPDPPKLTDPGIIAVRKAGGNQQV